MASIIILFKSFEMAPSTTHCKDNKKIIICQFSTTYVWIESQDYWSTVVIPSYEKEINVATWTKALVLFIINARMQVAIPHLIVLN